MGRHLRAAPRKYQLDLEIVKKSNFSKLTQSEAHLLSSGQVER